MDTIQYEVLLKLTEDCGSIILRILKPHKTIVLTQHADDSRIICITTNMSQDEMRHIFKQIVENIPIHKERKKP